MQVRANDSSACIVCDLEAGGGEFATIKASVGVGGTNAKPDVLAVQRLLNGVTPEDGGPVPLLAEDSLVGPLTNGAIKRFQTKQALKVVDSRVDPSGPTLKRLNEVSEPGRRAVEQLRALLGGAVPDGANLAALGGAVRQSLRLQRVRLAIASLVDAARKAERAAEMAMDHLTAGGRLGGAPADAFRLSDVANVAVVVEQAVGKKCARSWKILPTVGDDSEYPDVSPRDADALREWKALGVSV